MLRSELIALIRKDQPDLSYGEVERAVACIFEAISKRIAEGGRVELRGFGTFTTHDHPGHVGRNPRTGAAVYVPPKRSPYFKPGKQMRRRVDI